MCPKILVECYCLAFLLTSTLFNFSKNNTAARIMSTTLKIGNICGLPNLQLEKKSKLLFSYRNIWKHKTWFINAKIYHSSTNFCTIPSLFWIWIPKISIASGNKKLAFWCKYLAFFTKSFALKSKMLKVVTLTLIERQVIHLGYQFLIYYHR